MNKQQIIPQKVINIAKAVQEAEQKGQQLVVIHKRKWGETAARKLAKGEQILPAQEPSSN